MKYIDVCSGISAPTAAWKPLGWEALCYAEIEPAPRAVLAHHYPDVPLRGDFTEIKGDEYGPVDLLVGGTPCQSFSIAGLRGGLADDRGNLALEYLHLADRARPRWLVWENVPGVLSVDGGRAFGAILGGMGELGYGVAYRILDAQFAGVPQRRRRVFVVGYLGDWRRAAAVLFERHSMSGNPAPRRQAREGITDLAPHGPGESRGRAGRSTDRRPATQAFGGGANCHPTDVATAVAAHPGGRYDIDCETFVTATLPAGGNATGGNRYPGMSAETAATMLIAHPLRAKHNLAHRPDVDTFVTHSLRGEGFDASEDGTGRRRSVPVAYRTTGNDGCYRTGDIVAALDTQTDPNGRIIAFGIASDALDRSGEAACGTAGGRSGLGITEEMSPTVKAKGPNAVAFQSSQSGFREVDTHATLDANNGSRRHNGVMLGSAVRHLTPRECERLQGFPDDFTLVPYRKGMMADGPRYKMLGNSMAVPVVRWIGERIQLVEAMAQSLEQAP